MAKVLVTGASGFIGTHLVAALAGRGDEVTCLVRKTSRVEPLREAAARLVFGDVTEPDSLAAGRCGPGLRVPRGRLLDGGQLAGVLSRESAGRGQRRRRMRRTDQPAGLGRVSSLAAAGPPPTGSRGSRPIRRRRCRITGAANWPASARRQRWPTGSR